MSKNVIPFTKDDIVTAYAALKNQGIEPVKGTFTKYKEGKLCGVCAVSAYLIHSEKATVEQLNSVTTSFNELLGISDPVMWAFIDGFDRPELGISSPTPERTAAYELGIEINNIIFTE